MWRGGIYLGLGPGAHGYDGSVRRANRPDLAGYLAALEKGEEPPREQQAIDEDTRREEWIFLGLRLREGRAWEDLAARLGSRASAFRERAAECVKAGFLADDGERVRIADDAIFVSNAVTAELLAAV